MGNNHSLSAISVVPRRGTGTKTNTTVESRDTTVAENSKSSDSESEYLDCTDGAAASSKDHGNVLPSKVLMADDSSSSDGEADSHLSALDRLLVQQRRERMLELQSIQDQNRRVSDGKHCKRLDRFFSRAQNGDNNQAETDSLSSDSDDSTTTAVNQRSVVLEVRGLFQSQPVTSVLGSNNFRSQLEGIIRGNLIRQEREVETALRLRNAGLPGNTMSGRPLTEAFVPANMHEEASTVSSSTHSSVNIHPSSAAGSHLHGNQLIPTPPPPPPGIINQFMPIPNEYQPMPMAYPQPRRAESMQQQLLHPVPIVQHGNPQVSGQQGLNVGGVAPQSPWLLNRGNQPNGLVEDIHQVHRESIITEISNLVQSQLVTSTLESNFRGQLEVMLQHHASTGGNDRQQVVDFIQRLPRRENIARNDFSHLGINPSGAAGTTQGFQSPNYNMAQDMATLRSQMVELQNMVKVSFDLQLDLQRSIRQEVAAALHSSQGGNSANAAVAASSNREVHPAEEGHCIICLDKSIDSVLYQCGHMCVCLTCGLRLKDLGSHCPMCRAPIRDVIRAYKCHEQ